jgi:pimeloyl-ACP methyl ester carboxylesterase
MSVKTVRSRRNKSTNVRLYFRGGMRLLSWIAPRQAEKLALRLFATPRRPPRSRTDPAAEVAGRRFVVAADGNQLTAWEWGAGPTVVLTHGWSGHAGQLVGFVDPLVRAGHRVVAFDHPAHGQSSGRRTNYVGVSRALAAVAQQVGPVSAVIAHSLGSTATILALTRGLEVERVVLVAPPADPPGYARGFGRAIGLPQARIDGMLERIRVLVGGDLQSIDGRRLATEMRVPALILHDRGDPEVPFAHGEAIAAAWPGARLEGVEGLGHNRILRDPAVIARAVEFVRAGNPAASGTNAPGLASARR